MVDHLDSRKVIKTTVFMVKKTLEINPIVINDLIRIASCRCCLSSPSPSNLPLLSLLQLHPVIKAAVLAEICFENWDVNSNYTTCCNKDYVNICYYDNLLVNCFGILFHTQGVFFNLLGNRNTNKFHFGTWEKEMELESTHSQNLERWGTIDMARYRE